MRERGYTEADLRLMSFEEIDNRVSASIALSSHEQFVFARNVRVAVWGDKNDWKAFEREMTNPSLTKDSHEETYGVHGDMPVKVKRIRETDYKKPKVQKIR